MNNKIYDFSRSRLYYFMANDFDYSQVFGFDSYTIYQLRDIYRRLFKLIKEVEKDFSISNRKRKVGNQQKYRITNNLNNILKNNNELNELIENTDQISVGDFGERPQKIEVDLSEKKIEKFIKLGRPEYLFKDFLKATEASADYVIDEILSKEPDKFDIKNTNGNPQAFLSHAFKDRVFTFALFCFFYSRDIYLYIDWMHNQKIDNGADLKKNLSKMLDESESLIFVSTINSELSILGASSIRQWCSWEIGLFYSKNRDKFLIRVYSPIDENDSYQLSLSNIIYGNFKPVSKLIRGVGVS